jgi:SIR2-like protein
MSTIDEIWAFHPPEQQSDHGIAKGALATLLHAGQLVLFVGAGISSGLGLPEWNGLVTRCAALLGDKTDYSGVKSAADLMDAIDRMRRSSGASDQEMMATVRSALYGAVADDASPSHPIGVIDSRLLIALGAIMMSSARGSAAEVFTLNFDDILEWYLDLHGFKSEIVCELPRTLRGDVDVHTYHIHGFLPLMNERYETSSWMIFSKTQLEDRLSKDPTHPWEALLLSRLQSKVLLVVGTSMADTDLRVSVNRARASGVTRPSGYVLGVHDDDKVRELRELNMVPVTFADYDEIPGFILEVCQLAAGM